MWKVILTNGQVIHVDGENGNEAMNNAIKDYRIISEDIDKVEKVVH